MLKRSRKFLGVMLSVLLVINMVTVNKVTATGVENEGRIEVPNINPVVQSLEKLGDGFTITDTVTLIGEDEADAKAVKQLKELLDKYGVATTNEINPDNTMIILGEYSGDEADEKIQKLVTDLELTQDIALAKEEGYVLYVSNDHVDRDKGIIAIAGKDGDGTFYGVNTLEQILINENDVKIPEVKVSDYSDIRLRGIVEGFYGDQWTHEGRMRLLEFSGKQKMNDYIYGPKDDPYHKAKWREPYPAEQAEKLSELIQVADDNNVNFTWAIHPGGSITFTEEDYTALLAKLESVYEMGARSFAVFFDDISGPGTDANKQADFLNRINNDFVKAKGDIAPLIMCPTEYNKWWANHNPGTYLDILGEKLDEDIKIMWTGDRVMSDINKPSLEWVNNRVKRDVLVWWNFPVNDYCRDRLLMGESYGLANDVDNASGFVSNPMSHSEASMFALYSVANYSWNVEAYDSFESWESAIENLVPEVAEDFKVFAKHNADAYTAYHQYRRKESVEIQPVIDEFKEKLASGEALEASAESLIQEFNIIEKAGRSILDNCDNELLLNEINLWISSFEQLGIAGSSVIESIIALQNDDYETWWRSYLAAKDALDIMYKIDSENRQNQSQPGVKVATYAVTPFVKAMFKESEEMYLDKVGSNEGAIIQMSPITSYTNWGDINKIVDGDLNSYAYAQIQQKNGDYYGVDLGKVISVNDITILQGRTDTDHDIFHKGMLEYSVDGENWTVIGEERSGVLVQADNLNIEARYLRYRLTHAGIPGGKPDLWTAVREFSINKKSPQKNLTNIEALKDLKILKDNETGTINYPSVENLVINNGEYLGFEFNEIIKVNNLELELNLSSGELEEIALEYSINGVEWESFNTSIVDGVIKSTDSKVVKYVRAMNNSGETIKGSLERFLVRMPMKIIPVATTTAGIYEGTVNNLVDGNKDTYIWTSEQQVGQYYQVDLGKLTELHDVTVYSHSGDYVRSGILEVSKDGESWKSLNDFSDIPQTTIAGERYIATESEESKYNEVAGDAGGEEYRYIRLRVTGASNMWSRIYEIAVNETVKEDKVSVVTGSPSGEFEKVADNKIGTSYVAEIQPVEGDHLLYRMTQVDEMKNIIILQDKDNISNATVSVRTIDNNWIEVGKLDKAFNNISLQELVNSGESNKILDIKVDWNAAAPKPEIYEITPIYGQLINESAGGSTSIKVLEEINVNDNFEVTLGVSDIREDVRGYATEYTFKYNPEVFEYVGVEGVNENIFAMASEIKPGEIRVIVSSLGEVIESNSDLVKVNLKALKASGEEFLQVIDCIIGDGEGNTYDLDNSDNVVTVNDDKPVEIVVGKVSGLKASNVTNNGLNLTWNTPSTPVGLVEYAIYKDGKLLDTVPVGTNSYEVTGLDDNMIYGFKVTAKYSNGVESRPRSINIRTRK